jgi:large subunit ribosomal protein L17
MAASLIQHGAIRTTTVKAKELRRFVERIITVAKKGTLHARRRVIAELGDRAITDEQGDPMDRTVVQKLFDEVAPRYADRPGGYTRIIRLDERRIGDSGSQVILQLVEEGSGRSSGAGGGSSRRQRRAARRHEAADQAETPQQEEELEEEIEEEPEEQDEPSEDDQAPEDTEESADTRPE